MNNNYTFDALSFTPTIVSKTGISKTIYFSFLTIYEYLDINPFNPELFCTKVGGSHYVLQLL